MNGVEMSFRPHPDPTPIREISLSGLDLPSELSRCHAHGSREQATEGGNIFIADPVADFGDAQLRLLTALWLSRDVMLLDLTAQGSNCRWADLSFARFHQPAPV